MSKKQIEKRIKRMKEAIIPQEEEAFALFWDDATDDTTATFLGVMKSQ